MMKNNGSSKLVFIAGLGHSGSTLFDLLLGAQTGITGLGEVDFFINKGKRDWFLERYDKYPCTCNQKPSKCLVWGEFKEYIDTHKEESYATIYRKLFEISQNKTKSNIIVDSSKNLYSLKRVYNSLPEIGLSKDQFYVIHLIKDVRSFSVSFQRSQKRNSILRGFRHWRNANKRIENFIQSKDLKILKIGYEELSLNTKYIMQKVCDFFSDEKNSKVLLDLKKSGSHIIKGNQMRLDQAVSIRYDYRWFNDWKVNLYYSLLPGFQDLNKKWVYTNVEHSLDMKSHFEPPRIN